MGWREITKAEAHALGDGAEGLGGYGWDFNHLRGCWEAGHTYLRDGKRFTVEWRRPKGWDEGPTITVSHATSGYDDISTVYAYYTPAQKAEHGKHCEHWTDFGHRPETAPYRHGEERQFIASIEAQHPGKFASYLISWSNSN